MIYSLCVVASLLGASDALSKTTVQGLSLSAPGAWKVSDEEGSKSWEEPDGEAEMKAKLELSVFVVDPARPSAQCIKELKDGLNVSNATRLPDGGVAPSTIKFEDQKVGGQPAFRSVVFDYVGGAGSTKSDKNKVSTVTYVGCNGSTKWLITMTSPASKAPRFGALLKKIIDSVAYSSGR